MTKVKDPPLEQLLAEFPWLKKEIEKEARKLAQPMARQLASLMSEARLSEEKSRRKKEAEELVVSMGFKLLNILAVVVRAIKDAADKVGDENQIYFASHLRGTFWHLYFAVGFNDPGENLEAYGIDLPAREALETLVQSDELTSSLVNFLHLDVDSFDLQSPADRKLFERTTETMIKL
jgi:hypothetical protein